MPVTSDTDNIVVADGLVQDVTRSSAIRNIAICFMKPCLFDIQDHNKNQVWQSVLETLVFNELMNNLVPQKSIYEEVF